MKQKLVKLTEQQVLKKLDIPDFRHLSKDKVMTFFSMLPNMDPEVAVKALEQFPDFARAVKEIVENYKELLEKGFEENTASIAAYYDACNIILASLQKLLDKDNLSFEEQKYIIDQMMEVEKRMGKKETENKQFIKTIIGGACIAVIVAVGGLAAALGSNSGLSLPDLSADNNFGGNK